METNNSLKLVLLFIFSENVEKVVFSAYTDGSIDNSGTIIYSSYDSTKGYLKIKFDGYHLLDLV